ncbi:MAG: hypothetical protein KH972_07285 [Peptostreptococcaceae bacterium]|nr:hypothetical protein [Peptostreptococcaceae bacterium]
MKGKNPTRKQKELIKKNKLNYDNWLVLKTAEGKMHIKHKKTGNIKKIALEG